MVYVIEHLVAGEWQHVRHSDGQPMWFSYKAQAEVEMSRLKRNGKRSDHYRLQHIRD
jgi:hypothetical protein